MKKMDHVVPVSAKSFTQSHLDTTLLYINPKVWPNRYDNQTLKEKYPGLKFIKRAIIDTKDILHKPPQELLNSLPGKVMRSFALQFSNLMQVPRANGRGKESEDVWYSIQNNGYELIHAPISVCKTPDGNIWLIDGRTRYEELLRLGFTNIIADYYESDNYHSINKFSLSANPPAKPRSPQQTEDVIKVAIDEINVGRLKNEEKDIREFVLDVTDGAYTYTVVNNIVRRIQNSDGSRSVFYNNNEASEWLKKNGYHDNVNENGIFYFVVSNESKGSSILSAANYYKKLINDGEKVKELRLIINPGNLSGASAVKTWKKRIDTFRAIFNSNFDSIREGFFKNIELKKVIKVYGAIPTVLALAQQYPLDKLVIFHLSELKYKSFSDIDMENGLSRALELSEDDELEEI